MVSLLHPNMNKGGQANQSQPALHLSPGEQMAPSRDRKSQTWKEPPQSARVAGQMRSDR